MSDDVFDTNSNPKFDYDTALSVSLSSDVWDGMTSEDRRKIAEKAFIFEIVLSIIKVVVFGIFFFVGIFVLCNTNANANIDFELKKGDMFVKLATNLPGIAIMVISGIFILLTSIKIKIIGKK